jgi:competence protein ComEC
MVAHRTWPIAFAFFTAFFALPAIAQPTQELTVIRRGEPDEVNLPRVMAGNRDWMAAHFINVGQGAATLLEFSCGAVLVDTGGQEAADFDSTPRLIAYLNRVFERRPELNRTLDLVLLTHPHRDHTLGVEPILESTNPFRILNVVTNVQVTGSGRRGQRLLLEHARNNNLPSVRVALSDITQRRGLRNSTIDPLNCRQGAPDIRVLWGSAGGTGGWRTNGNNHSVVVRVEFGRNSFLITGDLAEGAHPLFVERYRGVPRTLNVDVYAPGHHGARDGTTIGLLDRITPQIAVISAGNPSANICVEGTAWDFGHPNVSTINLLTRPDVGVSYNRPLRNVAIGIRGRAPNDMSCNGAEFGRRDMTHAIFSTGWDGDIVVFANANGEKRVLID